MSCFYPRERRVMFAAQIGLCVCICIHVCKDRSCFKVLIMARAYIVARAYIMSRAYIVPAVTYGA